MGPAWPPVGRNSKVRELQQRRHFLVSPPKTSVKVTGLRDRPLRMILAPRQAQFNAHIILCGLYESAGENLKFLCILSIVLLKLLFYLWLGFRVLHQNASKSIVLHSHILSTAFTL